MIPLTVEIFATTSSQWLFTELDDLWHHSTAAALFFLEQLM